MNRFLNVKQMCFGFGTGGGSTTATSLLAVVFGYTTGPDEIQTNGSVGAFIRAVIKRAGTILETTAVVPNVGSPSLPYTVALQNGDCICVQTSNTNFNAPIVTDTKCIPTPGLGFAPNP